MKLKLFLIAASAMALASCSSDEVVKSNEDANVIKFSVVANNASRSSNYYCNNNMPADFDVWATVDGKSYFAGENYSQEDQAGNKTHYIPTDGNYRYWPKSLTKFYAAKNYGSTVAWTQAADYWTLSFKDFTPAPKADNQVDFIYAFNAGERGGNDAATTPLALNFRHALSQVVFQAQVKNEKIYVEIAGVKVCNVASKGDFALPTGENYTNGNIDKHDQTGNLADDATGIGLWSYGDADATKIDGSFEVDLATNIVVPYDEDNKTNLTDNEAIDNPTGYKKSLLLIPTDNIAYAPSYAQGATGQAAGQKGSYFLLDCRIYNISGATFDKTKDVCLWGGAVTDGMAAFKELAIPCAIDWKQGKKYIYTFVFNKNGHGGYDPEDGSEVLVPVDFTVTVDDFANEFEKEINDVNP